MNITFEVDSCRKEDDKGKENYESEKSGQGNI